MSTLSACASHQHDKFARMHHASNSTGEGEAAAPDHNLKVASEDTEGAMTQPAALAATSMCLTHGVDTSEVRTAVVHMPTEVWEMIFLQVPEKTVFVAQCVCRVWRDVIASSSTLRQKVFLRAPTSESAEKWGVPVHSWGIHRNVPHTVLRVTDVNNPPPNLAPAEQGHPGLFQPAKQLNPFLRQVESRDIRRRTLAFRLCLGEVVDLQLEDTLVFGPASWKQTYLTEYSCYSADVEVGWVIDGNRGNYRSRHTAQTTTATPQGFTLGTLLDACLDDPCEQWDNDSNGEWSICDRSLRDSLTRRERKLGGKARLDDMRVTMWDVVLPKGAEWGVVEG
ncbi:hypothetical protein LTR12_001730 [Friedmanniomyces endolithicus]|nr:hypothetical protein LTR74_007290 [Friedmanniomyces endolithicus]KAK1823775.1 hypothetical protein LTR12_001730 [Friedmanniomyces endolithicus]